MNSRNIIKIDLEFLRIFKRFSRASTNFVFSILQQNAFLLYPTITREAIKLIRKESAVK